MKRLPGWRGRLDKVLVRIEGLPFDFGRHDCALGLAAPCVQAITGVDLAAAFRGSYSDAEGAVASLRNHGHADLAALLAATFPEWLVDGAPAPALARHGDLALLKGNETGWSIGVFLHERVGCLAREGYATIPRVLALRAFQVG